MHKNQMRRDNKGIIEGEPYHSEACFKGVDLSLIVRVYLYVYGSSFIDDK
jgi:hypothetical protein